MSALDETSLNVLVESRVAETPSLDFKLDAYAAPGGVREWCKDISAMANTGGGCILMGVGEVDGVAASLDGIDDPERAKNRLNQAAASNVHPRVNVLWVTVPMANGRFVLGAAVKPSLAGPFMTTAENESRFYRRADTDTVRMNVDELRHAFLISIDERRATQRTHASSLRERFDAPSDNLRVFCDLIVPEERGEFFDPGNPSHKRLTEQVQPLDADSYNPRITFDGMQYRDFVNTRQFLAIRRTGAVRSSLEFRGFEDPAYRPIPALDVARKLSVRLKQWLRFQRDLAIPLPVYSCLTLDGCHHRRVDPGTHGPVSEQIDRDLIELPALAIDDFDIDTFFIIRPWMDRLFNAAGMTRCNFYDLQGNPITEYRMP